MDSVRLTHGLVSLSLWLALFILLAQMQSSRNLRRNLPPESVEYRENELTNPEIGNWTVKLPVMRDNVDVLFDFEAHNETQKLSCPKGLCTFPEYRGNAVNYHLEFLYKTDMGRDVSTNFQYSRHSFLRLRQINSTDDTIVIECLPDEEFSERICQNLMIEIIFSSGCSQDNFRQIKNNIYLQHLIPNSKYKLRVRPNQGPNLYTGWHSERFQTKTATETIVGYVSGANPHVYVHNKWGLPIQSKSVYQGIVTSRLGRNGEKDQGDSSLARALEYISAFCDDTNCMIVWRVSASARNFTLRVLASKQGETLPHKCTTIAQQDNKNIATFAMFKDVSTNRFHAHANEAVDEDRIFLNGSSNRHYALGYSLLMGDSLAPEIVRALTASSYHGILKVWTIANVTVDVVELDSAVLSWNIVGEGDVEGWSFRWLGSDYGREAVNETVRLNEESGRYEIRISHLEECKYYEGELVWNDTFVKSKPLHFTTKYSVETITDFLVEPRLHNALLSWNLKKCHYSSRTFAFQLNGEPGKIKEGNITYYALDSLSPATVYTISMVACANVHEYCHRYSRTFKTLLDPVLLYTSVHNDTGWHCTWIGTTPDLYHFITRDMSGTVLESFTSNSCFFVPKCINQAINISLSVSYSEGYSTHPIKSIEKVIIQKDPCIEDHRVLIIALTTSLVSFAVLCIIFRYLLNRHRFQKNLKIQLPMGLSEIVQQSHPDHHQNTGSALMQPLPTAPTEGDIMSTRFILR